MHILADPGIMQSVILLLVGKSKAVGLLKKKKEKWSKYKAMFELGIFT